ncbi:MAG TPA: Gfo/Idh/MocA family oxidoreductase [Acidimicrobiia bacterium]
MADQALGAAVVGTGFGCLTHVRALRAAGFTVGALVGRDPDKTDKRARKFEIPLATTSLTEALAAPGIDAVAVATPPLTHAPIALEAVAAGKHVICEKPFARDAAEARTMLDAAEQAGVVHFLGTEFRWATAQELTRRIVADGAIGEPRMATYLLHMPLLADPAAEVPDWWSDAAQGGGWLGAYASHVVDQVRSTLGEFEGVSASLPLVADHDWTAEDSYTVHFRLRSGAQGIMQASAGDWGPPAVLMRIAGTKGTTWAEGDAVYLATARGTEQVSVPADLVPVPPDPPPGDLMVTAYDLLHASGIDLEPYTRLAATFRDRILGRDIPKDPPPATFADGVAGMEVLDAIRRSAAERQWVPVSP